MKLAKTYGYLKKDLDAIETALHTAIQAEHPVLRKASTQLLNAGGKRIRPVFVLLCGQMADEHPDRLLIVAVFFDLIHMAKIVIYFVVVGFVFSIVILNIINIYNLLVIQYIMTNIV